MYTLDSSIHSVAETTQGTSTRVGRREVAGSMDPSRRLDLPEMAQECKFQAEESSWPSVAKLIGSGIVDVVKPAMRYLALQVCSRRRKRCMRASRASRR